MGVRQGGVISSQLFNILLELVMVYAIRDTNVVADIQGHIINNLRFADDIALIAESEEEFQTLVVKVHHISSTFGLKINVNKTEVQKHQQRVKTHIYT